jgi:hypothetical protein
MTTIRRFTCDDLFRFNNINLDSLTETVSCQEEEKEGKKKRVEEEEKRRREEHNKPSTLQQQ